MNDLKIYCEDYDFSLLAKAFEGEFESDCTLLAEVEIVNEERIKDLNSQLRGVDAVTDVLSFPTIDGLYLTKIEKNNHPFECDEDGNLLIGSIAICMQRAKEQAEEYGHSLVREINYLAAHGVCHLLGYDHMEEEDKAIMRAKEEAVLGKINITRDI